MYFLQSPNFEIPIRKMDLTDYVGQEVLYTTDSKSRNDFQSYAESKNVTLVRKSNSAGGRTIEIIVNVHI